MIRCGFKNKYQRDMYTKEIKPRVARYMITIIGSTVNIKRGGGWSPTKSFALWLCIRYSFDKLRKLIRKRPRPRFHCAHNFLLLIVCFISLEKCATPFMIFNINYSLKLHNVITMHYRSHCSSTKLESVGQTLENINNCA